MSLEAEYNKYYAERHKEEKETKSRTGVFVGIALLLLALVIQQPLASLLIALPAIYLIVRGIR